MGAIAFSVPAPEHETFSGIEAPEAEEPGIGLFFSQDSKKAVSAIASGRHG